MYILVLFACCLLSSQSMARAAYCTDDDKCAPQYYCETSSFLCKECQQCEVWKRKPLAHSGEQCVRTIVQCGVCLDGYIETEDGFRSPCVLPASSVAAVHGVPAYVWVLLGVLTMLVALGVLMLYVMRSQTFKLKIRTWIHGPSEHPSEHHIPSAPEDPPPYNNVVYAGADATPPFYPVYQPTTVPYVHPAPTRHPDEEGESLIKVSPGGAGMETGSRTLDTRQAARVFNKPSYVRGPHLPTSDETGADSDHEPALHDENTSESLWTPHEPNNNSTVSTPAEVSGATGATGATAASVVTLTRHTATVSHRDKQLARPAPASSAQPPTKVLRVWPNGSSNREQQDTLLAPDISSIEQHGPSFNINFQQNIISVQRNNISK